MATLEKIRNKSGLLVAVIGIALFAFIIGEFLNSGSSYSTPSDRVGKVEGNELTFYDFQQDITTATDVMKSMGRPASDDDIRNMVWDNFVGQSLLMGETSRIGMNVTLEEMKDVTLGDNIHPLLYQIPFLVNEQGVYDPNRLKEILTLINRERTVEEKQAGVDQAAELRNHWMFWENLIKQQVLAAKYQTLMAKAMAPTTAFASILADLNSKETDAVCAARFFYSVPDSAVVINDADLQAKYKEMKDNNFKTEGFRSVKAISFDVIPSSEDSASAESTAQEAKTQLAEFENEDIGLLISQMTDPLVPFIAAFRSENDINPEFRTFAFSEPKGKVADVMLSGEFYKTAKVASDVELRPDSVKVSHILVQRTSDEEAQRVADSLVAELKKGADFTVLVGQFSANTASVPNAGDLGWFKEGAVGLENFDEQLFTAKVGEPVTVAVPQQGIVHVMKVTERTNPVKKVKLAEVAIRVVPSNATYTKIYNQANDFILQNNTLELFETAAQAQGLMVRPLDRLAKNQSSVYYFEQSRPIIKWAWENKNGAVSKVFELPNSFVVAAVYQAVEEGFIPYSYVQDQVKVELLKDKKAEMLLTEMTGISDLQAIPQVNRIDTLKSVTFNQVNFGNIGREPVIAAMAYKTNVNEISSPVRGNTGVFVLKAMERREVPADVSQEVKRQNDNLLSIISRSIMESLKKQVTIEDNRFKF